MLGCCFFEPPPPPPAALLPRKEREGRFCQTRGARSPQSVELCMWCYPCGRVVVYYEIHPHFPPCGVPHAPLGLLPRAGVCAAAATRLALACIPAAATRLGLACIPTAACWRAVAAREIEVQPRVACTLHLQRQRVVALGRLPLPVEREAAAGGHRVVVHDLHAPPVLVQVVAVVQLDRGGGGSGGGSVPRRRTWVAAIGAAAERRGGVQAAVTGAARAGWHWQRVRCVRLVAAARGSCSGRQG